MIGGRSAYFSAVCALLAALRAVAGEAPPVARADDVSHTCAPAQPEARRRPGREQAPIAVTPCDPQRLPLPAADRLPAPEPMVDRWRIVEALGYRDNRLDPYAGNNPLKGDRPIFGRDGYLAFTATSSSLAEPRRVPTAAGGSIDQLFLAENISLDAVVYEGDTVFRPPDYQLRVTPVVSYSQTQARGTDQRNTTFGMQALFVEKHLRDVSPRYDFDSVRIGIQPVTTDFRGFLMLDQPAGVRLFGTRSNNQYQYNLAWLRPLAKNAARLNDLGTAPPREDIVLANLYRQDLLRPGFNAAIALVYDRTRNHDIVYLGASGDGHFGRLNMTGAAYVAGGRESASALSGSATDVRAFFAAAELSVDFDWIRARLSALHASGDASPLDDRASGFAGLTSAALFAGADASFFLHQRLPLTGTIDLKQRDRLFDDLGSADASVPASFSGPGLRLLGLGADFDFSPRLRLSLDANQLWFDEAASLLLLAGKAAVDEEIGQDISATAFFRPFHNQNVILRISAAVLNPGRGYRDLYGDRAPYSALCNLIVAY